MALTMFEATVLGLFMVLTSKVFKIVRWSDKYMLAMLLFLQLHIFANMLFYMFHMIIRTPALCRNVENTSFVYLSNIILILDFVPVFFLGCALIVNCRNW